MKKSWNDIVQEEKKKKTAKNQSTFDLWEQFGEQILKDTGAGPDDKGWEERTIDGKKQYVWLGTGDSDEEAYDRAMEVL